MKQSENQIKASNLKVRKGNVMKDFLTIAGPMNVSHLLTFSKTNESVSFRLITTPKGPTLSFKVEEFVLRKYVDISGLIIDNNY